MASRREPRTALHIHRSGGKEGRLPVVLIHIAARVQGMHPGYLHLTSLHRPRPGIENMPGQVPDGTFSRAGRVHHMKLAVLQGPSVHEASKIVLRPVPRKRECHGGIRTEIAEAGSGIQMRDGIQRQIMPVHVHHAPAVAEDELPGHLVFPGKAHHYSAPVQLHVTGRVAVPVQNQISAATHVDIRRIVPVAADDQIAFPNLPPLVSGGSGQQGGDRSSLVHHKARRIQAAGRIAPVAQHVIAVEGEGARSGIHGPLEHDCAAGAVKNQIIAGVQLLICSLCTFRGGVPA